MPEGDSVAGHAEMLAPVLVGRRITEVGGTSPSLRRGSGHVLDATVEEVRTVGKNLIVDLSGGYSIRVHLGMTGRWLVIPSAATPAGSARLVLGTGSHRVACFAAPNVTVDRTRVIDAGLERLGPDLLGDFDEEQFLGRVRLLAVHAIGEVLLDQRVLAGIGNVYKSETLFLERVHPWAPVEALEDATLLALARRAGRLLAANVGRSRRSTTGRRGIGTETWVYGRAGKPCRRCGSRIEQLRQGDRVTYWCPACQPLVGLEQSESSDAQ